jgi:hypothetical protein
MPQMRSLCPRLKDLEKHSYASNIYLLTLCCLKNASGLAEFVLDWDRTMLLIPTRRWTQCSVIRLTQDLQASMRKQRRRPPPQHSWRRRQLCLSILSFLRSRERRRMQRRVHRRTGNCCRYFAVRKSALFASIGSARSIAQIWPHEASVSKAIVRTSCYF